MVTVSNLAICIWGIILLALLIRSKYKKNAVNKESNLFTKPKTDAILSSDATPIVSQKEIGKNKWLHPTDPFGKMEKGVQH